MLQFVQTFPAVFELASSDTLSNVATAPWNTKHLGTAFKYTTNSACVSMDSPRRAAVAIASMPSQIIFREGAETVSNEAQKHDQLCRKAARKVCAVSEQLHSCGGRRGCH